MGCERCGAVAIPDSMPSICPECFMLKSRPVVVGLDETPITVEVANQRVPGLVDPIADGEFISKVKFYLTDFDHVAIVSQDDGRPFVWIQDHWASWDEYLAFLRSDDTGSVSVA